MGNTLSQHAPSQYTYKDYLTWPEHERWELIEGIPFNMTPAPSRIHQDVSRELLTFFSRVLKGSSCKVYGAPFDVRLPLAEENTDDKISTVVQPDLVIICDLAKLDDRGCKGSPDLTIEITSPSTFSRDLKAKLNLYERAGVGEYWIVYPENRTIVVFRLENGQYGKPAVYTHEDQISIDKLIPSLSINLQDIFVD